ncbi:MAG: DNA polymerase III subunit gamma/tau [Patescibacteria group bacterium]|nr:DNA polymerase III subunit gamma/tau [Patescibacteria group bacterium]
MPTLYRDYRPQKFADILGQNHLKITLQNELADAKLGQAYLFCGPRAVGKTSMARVLAQAVNCERRQPGESEPCGECAACLSIKRGQSLDVMEIDAASNTGVDNVRDNIIASARLAPSGKMRVFIIDEVHMLSLSAFNALLKIIEEPPQHVLFILCTTEVHKVPATIISRCQRFDFKRISPAEIVKKLSFIASQEKIEISREVLEDISRQSGGHLRDAESLFGQVLALGEKKIGVEEAELILPRHHNQEALELIDFLAKKNPGGAVSLINQLADSGINFKNFLEEILLILRKIMLQSAQPGLAEKLGLDLGESLELRVSRLSAELPLAACLRIMRRFLELSQEKPASIPQLPFEMAAVELCLSAGTDDKSASIAGGNRPMSSLAKEAAPKAEKVSAPTAVAADLDEREVAALWPEILVKIKKHNHSLSFVLQNCVPQALKSGLIPLHFKYKFHRDRILDPSIKAIMEETLAEVFQGKVAIEALLDENLELDAGADVSVQAEVPSAATAETKKPGGVLGGLMENFGAEVL